MIITNLLLGQQEIHLIKYKIGSLDILKFVLQNCKLKSFLEYNEENIYSNLMFQNREAFIKIWQNLEEKQKENMINNSVNIIDTFDENVFANDQSIKTNKMKKLSQNEILFKLLLQLNNYFINDKESQKDLQAIKEDIKALCRKQISDYRNNKKENNFVKSSICFNLKMALDFNHFFQNFFVEDLHRLYIKQQFQDDIESKGKPSQKKKNKKRRRKKKKKAIKEDEIEQNINLQDDSKQNLQDSLEDSENLQFNIIQQQNNLSGNQQVYKEDQKNDQSQEQNDEKIQNNKKKSLQNDEIKLKNQKSNQKSKSKNQQQSQTECQGKKDEQYSTENSLLNQKNFQIENNHSKIKKFQQNYQFKKLSNSNIDLQKNFTNKKNKQNQVEIQLGSTQHQLQLSQNSSFEQEQQDWYVQTKKNKKSKKNRKKRKRKKTNTNQIQNQKKKNSQKIQNIQVSKPMNYLSKLTKWNDKDDKKNSNDKFLFDQDNLTQQEIQNVLRQKIQKIVNLKFNEVLNELINKIETITKKQEQGRSIIKKRLNHIIKQSIKKTSVKKQNVFIKEYGSYASKILTPFSDMDIYIQFSQDIDKDNAIQYLKIVNENLKNQNFIKMSKDILTASIPVLKIIADPSLQYKDFKQTNIQQNIKVDLTVNLSSINILNSSYVTTDFIKCSCNVYKSLQRNMIFLKYLFTIKQLNNAYLGGLNSYGMSLMYISFLERIKGQNSTDLFNLLIQFFIYYGLEFDPQKIVIDLGYGMSYKYNPFISRGYYNIQNMSQILINDPTSVVFSNVTQTCTTWSIIQQFFQRIAQQYFNIVEYMFNDIIKQDLKKMTENQFLNHCNELLKYKELYFQNIFESKDFFLNPEYFVEQQQKSQSVSNQTLHQYQIIQNQNLNFQSNKNFSFFFSSFLF